MENIQTPDTQTVVSSTPQQTSQAQSPWEALAKSWESLAQRAQSLTPQAQAPQAPVAQYETSSSQYGEAVEPEYVDPTIQSWLDQGISPSDVNAILSVVPYTAQVPEIAGDFEAMAIIASDPDFDQFKNDPAYWVRLRENLQSEGIVYNDALPTGQSQGQGPLSFPPNFASWGNPGDVHPYYQQNSVALGRMLAEMGGDFDMGPRY